MGLTENGRAGQDTLLLRPRDAARLLSVSESTLDRLRRRGEIRPLKVGAAVLYARSELERWVRQRMNDGERIE